MKKQESEALLRKDIAIGSAWMVSMRWSIRVIGLVSIVVLARLLTPTDFGIVAKSMIFVSFVQVFSEAGFGKALIRNSQATVTHYHSAWTGQLVVGISLTIVTILLAPLAGFLLNEDKIIPVIWALSLRVLCVGFENIGVIDFEKYLQFDKKFRFGLYRRLISFPITIGLALTIRNYWALVIGIVSAELAMVFLSYKMHPFRPRISFAHVREVWGFSFWILVGSVGRFLGEKADQVVVAGAAETTAMGVYNVSAEVATMPMAEVITPLSTALFPSYAKLLDQPRELAKAFLNVLSVLCVLTASVSAGLALVAPEFVLIVLGEQWEAAIPIMRWLSLAAGVWVLVNSVFLILVLYGEGKSFAAQNWLRLLLLFPSVVIGFLMFGLEGAAIARLIALLILVPFSFLLIIKILPIAGRELLDVCWRPIAAAAFMALCVQGIRPMLVDFGLFSRTVLLVASGGISFTLALGVLWQIVGRPRGIESAALRWTRSLLKKVTWLKL